MTSTTFVDGETLIEASWLNDVNAAVYTPGTQTAADIANVPAGSITATDVQAALNELDTEKVAVASIGTTVQAWDAQLDALALLSTGTASGNIPLVGTKSATKILPGLNYDIPQIQPVGASVSANALTLTLDPTTLDFRSATLTSGTVNTRQVAAQISLVVSSGSTLGCSNASAQYTTDRIAILAIDNAGTVELAAVNLAGGVNLDETTRISTTAEGGAGGADSATVIYSATAITDKPFRVVGVVTLPAQVTAGTWALSPTLVQGAGGNAASAMMSIGYGQTWQDVKTTPGRAVGTTYYNTTGKPIVVSVNTSTTGTIELKVNGVRASYSPTNSSASGIVPPGASYLITTAQALDSWTELR